MTEVVATTLGLLPATLATDGTVTDDADAVDGEGDGEPWRSVVARQRAAGLDRLTLGRIEWGDGLASPLLAAAGVSRGPHEVGHDGARHARPQVETDPGPVSLVEATDAVEDERRLEAIPGPYTLARLTASAGTDALTTVTDWLVDSLDDHAPARTVVLHEPAFVADPPGDGPDARASAAIHDVCAAVDAETVVALPGGAPTEKVYAHLLDASFDAVGFDLTADHEGCLRLANEYGTTDDVGLCVVADGKADPDSIDDRVGWWLGNTPVASFDRVYATPGGVVSEWAEPAELLSALGDVTRRR